MRIRSEIDTERYKKSIAELADRERRRVVKKRAAEIARYLEITQSEIEKDLA